MQKVKDRYHNCAGKEKAAEYYIANNEALKENAINKYRNLSKEKKSKKKRIWKKIDIKTWQKIKKTH